MRVGAEIPGLPPAAGRATPRHYAFGLPYPAAKHLIRFRPRASKMAAGASNSRALAMRHATARSSSTLIAARRSRSASFRTLDISASRWVRLPMALAHSTHSVTLRVELSYTYIPEIIANDYAYNYNNYAYN